MKKTAIVYGTLSPLRKKAIEMLTTLLLDYTYEYLPCYADESEVPEGYRKIYLGTPESNPYIKPSGLTHAEEYRITVSGEDVWIEGADDHGVLYGAVDFYNKYIAPVENPPHDRYWINPFERPFPDFELTSAPSVRDRGIWTWGHVIYDYRGFFDNMVKCKMNTVVIWNDHAPLNAREMIDYAHSCGIKLFWGFPWLWDTSCKKFTLKDIEGAPESIFNYYEKNYANLGADGIYFQSFTEVREETIEGKLIAEVVTDFVNKTAALLYEKHPDLKIQFGLHATSVKDRLSFLQKVDPRMYIVWEDCGAFPYSYIPSRVDNFDETVAFTKEIAVLRGKDDRFGVVTKGLTKLDWKQFEHLQGSLYTGVSSKFMKADRVLRKNRIWRSLQARWLRFGKYAYEMAKVLSASKDGDLMVLSLVEDGMFEENIMFPVALYSEMLWDADKDYDRLVESVAFRNYVTFA